MGSQSRSVCCRELCPDLRPICDSEINLYLESQRFLGRLLFRVASPACFRRDKVSLWVLNSLSGWIPLVGDCSCSQGLPISELVDTGPS